MIVWTRLAVAAAAMVSGTVEVPRGTYLPFYPASADAPPVAVAAFAMDVTPVTLGDFRRFVQEDPRWRRDRVARLLADKSYLDQWSSPDDPGAGSLDAPVTQVSWHAARAYCQSRGGDLPTVDQWEYAADATATATSGARQDSATLDLILAWYGRGGSTRPGPVGQGAASAFGLRDMHGLIWEWTLDYNSLLIATDDREGGDEDRLRFCGSGAIGAADPGDYATYMRFAFRSSLAADHTTHHLGFRCAYPSSSSSR